MSRKVNFKFQGLTPFFLVSPLQNKLYHNSFKFFQSNIKISCLTERRSRGVRSAGLPGYMVLLFII
ncbi:MAG: hypothetical protein A2Y00_04405 [Omnitrophica WOR_2 bacterium GWF2_43_52]|nr:MAG: hypothetical protein A2Y00_04405 [Omnitrophica WOR_2 bacterium GWF2_43_52]OGX54793.1 MAG: hypothetical protein A2460_01805 [Omnitrophica WOR_2 bacterium RIFOXYC2_FULL_43_9]HAH21882.1 hypothetical protein [Candidatus Omnitrophota bacterium]HBG64024.1 hypothetical protein [Candidatus Omnitrophota bacterium]